MHSDSHKRYRDITPCFGRVEGYDIHPITTLIPFLKSFFCARNTVLHPGRTKINKMDTWHQ